VFRDRKEQTSIAKEVDKTMIKDGGDFLEKGYHIERSVFEDAEISKIRKISKEFFKDGGGFVSDGGYAKPDWIKESSLSEIVKIWNSKKIGDIISRLMGEPVKFIGHNDLHLNRSVGWHKDRLNNDARVFEINSPWDSVGGETMKIYKVNFYLQDHENNNDGLIIRESSHKVENMTEGEIKIIHPKLGDIVIFDQRITHKAHYSGGYDRFLICMGYGVENDFFHQFKQGTEFRQNKQNGVHNNAQNI